MVPGGGLLGRGAVARHRVAARARCAYRIAPVVLDRLCERERPDGMLSLVRLPGWFEHASGEITIPMLGRADSLNVAVSASILMYDIRSVLSGAARAAP